MNTQNTAEQPQETHFFLFNTHTWPNAIERVSVAEFNDGEAAMLTRKEYQRMQGGSDHIELYASTFTNDKYLVIVRVEHYRFIFYIHDDASLLEWKRQYEQIPQAFLAQKLLPPPPTKPEMVTIPMNVKALRGR